VSRSRTPEPNHAQREALGGAATSRRVNYQEAAEYLGLKLSTLRSMVCRRRVPHIRLGPQLVVFDLAQLDAWLAECAVPATSTT
jgi:excisionase family DNA binding protein